jgi:hypothetical protein
VRVIELLLCLVVDVNSLCRKTFAILIETHDFQIILVAVGDYGECKTQQLHTQLPNFCQWLFLVNINCSLMFSASLENYYCKNNNHGKDRVSFQSVKIANSGLRLRSEVVEAGKCKDCAIEMMVMGKILRQDCTPLPGAYVHASESKIITGMMCV